MNDRAPLVSVAMITFNHEPYLAKAIESVLAQRTDFDVEIVVGEDCSTDNTMRILSRYSDEYRDKIRVITSEKNVGMHANIERTEKACRGKYLAYLEGDDFFNDPDKLRKQVQFLESHQDYDLVHGDFDEYFQEEKKFIRNYNKHFRIDIAAGDVFRELLIRNFISTCTVCLRRESLEKYFDYGEVAERKGMLGDYPRWLDIAAHSKVGYIDESLSTYRVLKQSATHSPDGTKRMDTLVSQYNVKLFYVEKYGCPQEVKNVILQNHAKELLETAFRNRDREQAIARYADLKSILKAQKRTDFDSLMCYWGAKNTLCHYVARLYFKAKRTLEL